jgi:putative transposase
MYDEGVGDLTDVLETHWSVRVNEKTHNFWAFKKFIHRLAHVCEEYGISFEAESET